MIYNRVSANRVSGLGMRGATSRGPTLLPLELDSAQLLGRYSHLKGASTMKLRCAQTAALDPHTRTSPRVGWEAIMT